MIHSNRTPQSFGTESAADDKKSGCEKHELDEHSRLK
jgi:hypothetical protein